MNEPAVFFILFAKVTAEIRAAHIGLTELPASRVVFATDYPQAVHCNNEVIAYVNAVRTLGPEVQAVLNGANAEKLIPDLNDRLKARSVSRAATDR